MTTPTVGRCGDPAPAVLTVAPAGATCCALPHGHAGWHRDDHGTEWHNSHPPAITPPAVDLRALAVILDVGADTASRFGGGALHAALRDMAKMAVELHLDADGQRFDLDRMVAALAHKLI